MTTTAGPPGLVRLREVPDLTVAARELLARAARFDAEMGFGPPPPDLRRPVDTVIEIDTCLHRHDVAHDDHYVPAGVVCIRDLGGGTGSVELVVDPLRRAIGVATSVLEVLGTEPDPVWGWAGTGLHVLHAVALGNHPAAERLARRSGVATDAVRHHLVLPVDEPAPDDPQLTRDRPDGTVAGTDDDREVVLRDVTGGSARLRRPGPDGALAGISEIATAPGTPEHARCAALVTLVGAAVVRLRAEGAGAVEAVADAGDGALLLALRRLRFEHDRTDLVFRIGPAR
ncbi:hypothetical protein DMP17_40130 [Pseudonocardia sp. TMWB2A]|uniref:hypothetical protein n=1 Tax=unclassified Pseudonocardia TaxID=2619320 RepID=UPI001CF71A30|nr:hypothetical protein [Pseudonocardia sp. ICBG162]